MSSEVITTSKSFSSPERSNLCQVLFRGESVTLARAQNWRHLSKVGFTNGYEWSTSGFLFRYARIAAC